MQSAHTVIKTHHFGKHSPFLKHGEISPHQTGSFHLSEKGKSVFSTLLLIADMQTNKKELLVTIKKLENIGTLVRSHRATLPLKEKNARLRVLLHWRVKNVSCVDIHWAASPCFPGQFSRQQTSHRQARGRGHLDPWETVSSPWDGSGADEGHKIHACTHKPQI